VSQFDHSPSAKSEHTFELKTLGDDERVREVLRSLPAQLTKRGDNCPACAEFMHFEDFAIPSLLALSLVEKDEDLRRSAMKELGAVATKVVSLMKIGAVEDMDRATALVIEAISSLYQSAAESEDRVFREDAFTALSRVGIDVESSKAALLGSQTLTSFTDPFVKVRERSRSFLREVLEQ